MVAPYDKSKNLEQKRALAARAVQMVEDDMVIGLGSGSTMEIFSDLLAERIKKEQMNLHFVPSSKKIEQYGLKYDLNFIEIDHVVQIDLAFDGADRIDTTRNLIKGGGGSLFRERQVLEKADKKVIIADHSKFVKDFTNVFIPIEIVPYNYKGTIYKIAEYGFHGDIRNDKGFFVTDNGNYIIDVQKQSFFEVKSTYEQLKLISGVVEVGLFKENQYTILK